MSVSRRGDSWKADVRVGDRRLRRDFPTKEEAEDWELHTRRQLQQNDDDAGATAGSLKDLLESTRARHWDGTKGEYTAVSNSQQFVDFLGADFEPGRINSLHIDRFISHLKKQENSNGTINRKLAAVSKMLTHGQKRGWVKSVPSIERLPEHEHRIRYLTPEEETRFCEYWEERGDVDMVHLIQFAIDTGLRASELFALTHDDIQEERIVLAGTKTKSGKNRVIPLTHRAAGIVGARIDNDPIFGSALSYWVANHKWNQMKRDLGLKKDTQLVIHALRHTFATRLMTAGANPVEVQRLMGHSSIEMTMRYTHVSDERLESAILKLDQFSLESDLQGCAPRVPQTGKCALKMGHLKSTEVLAG